MSIPRGPWKLKIARTLAHLHGPNGFIGISLPYRTDAEKELAHAIAELPEMKRVPVVTFGHILNAFEIPENRDWAERFIDGGPKDGIREKALRASWLEYAALSETGPKITLKDVYPAYHDAQRPGTQRNPTRHPMADEAAIFIKGWKARHELDQEVEEPITYRATFDSASFVEGWNGDPARGRISEVEEPTIDIAAALRTLDPKDFPRGPYTASKLLPESPDPSLRSMGVKLPPETSPFANRQEFENARKGFTKPDLAQYKADRIARGACPECGHAAHGEICLNLASDNDCSCRYDSLRPPVPDDEIAFVDAGEMAEIAEEMAASEIFPSMVPGSVKTFLFKRFYFTFGSGQLHEGKYVVVHALEEARAREAMINAYGAKWSMVYTYEQWNEGGTSQAETYGYTLLQEILAADPREYGSQLPPEVVLANAMANAVEEEDIEEAAEAEGLEQ